MRFGTTYHGTGKAKLGALGLISAASRSEYAVTLAWFRTTTGPPPTFGSFDDFLKGLSRMSISLDAGIVAQFAYKKSAVKSVLEPITLSDQTSIFDEITGFTGLKKDAQGKMFYQMQVTFHGDTIKHQVSFAQKVVFSEDTAAVLLDYASRISALALKPSGK